MERTVCHLGMADGTWGVRMFPKGRRLRVKDAPQASHFRECRAMVDGLMGEFYFFLPPISIRPVPGARHSSRNLGYIWDRTDFGSLWSFYSSRAMRPGREVMGTRHCT